mmetsp:Transcript_37433/g.64985  ORF Transcript_37433/g.64985 Transcript_37433/m.64985 type:complete len:90 (-) Transcript_37433:84-353(-)
MDGDVGLAGEAMFVVGSFGTSDCRPPIFEQVIGMGNLANCGIIGWLQAALAQFFFGILLTDFLVGLFPVLFLALAAAVFYFLAPGTLRR